jgi:hypothetical protein
MGGPVIAGLAATGIAVATTRVTLVIRLRGTQTRRHGWPRARSGRLTWNWPRT